MKHLNAEIPRTWATSMVPFPLKRKRPHAAMATGASLSIPPQPQGTTRAATKAASTVARRATRQTSHVAPPPIPWAADPEPRRRRKSIVSVRAVDNDHSDSEDNREENDARSDDQDEQPSVLVKKASLRSSHGGRATSVSLKPAAVSVATGKRGTTAPQPEKQHRPVLQTTNQADPAMVPKPVIRNRASRLHSRHHHDPEGAKHFRNRDTNGPAVAPLQSESPSAAGALRRRRSAVGPPLQPPPLKTIRHPAPSQIVPIMDQPQPRSVKVLDPIAANSSKHVLPTVAHSMASSPPRPVKKRMPAKQHPERKPGTIDRNIDKVVFGNVCFSTWYHSPYGTEALEDISGNVKANGIGGIKDGGSKEEALSNPNRRTKEEILDRLYVCPSCFKYSKELVPWWQHVHQCERRGHVPGRKIYTHPKGRRARHGAAGPAVMPKGPGPGRKRKASDAASAPYEEEVQDKGEWSIWEVDGEEEGLFCQNLSLFAKLFLDNKSVFFDVVGFKYFLLVHTTARPPTEDGEHLPPKRQVVGFFSKEKLSWDNNNLACILVFPPWQRKGLGALLMGISYEISRREGMLGGPEKPISDLGKKGYKRFWAGEVAAWLLSVDTSGEDEEEVVVDVDECSKATWILPEDCLLVLREMDVVEEAEAGPPKKKKKKAKQQADGDDDDDLPPDEEGGEDAVMSGEVEEVVVQDVPRVRLCKEAVWNWVRVNRILLEPACDPDGFVEGYAVKRNGVEEVEEV